MVNVSIDVTDLGGEARPGDKVVFWRPRMGGSATHAGRVISTAPVTVFLTDGKATVSGVEPGEMTVLLQCRGVESQGPVTVGVPDGDHTVTLRALLESQFEYAPPIVSAVQEAASNASASEEAAIQAQIRSEAAADRAEDRVDEAINNGAELVRDEVKQDADRAVSARQAAVQSESNAAASEDAAASSASNAAASESAAKQSETNAGDYAAVATTAATEAVDAMETASDAASSIVSSVSAAAGHADRASQSESGAAAYAQNASDAADRVGTAEQVGTWAQQAQDAADRIGTAETVEGWVNSAQDSASAAEQSASKSKEYRDTALSAASSTADELRGDLINIAGEASNHATESSRSAARAKTSETNAATHEANSLSAAERAEFAATETIQQVEGDFATRNYVDALQPSIDRGTAEKWLTVSNVPHYETLPTGNYRATSDFLRGIGIDGAYAGRFVRTYTSGGGNFTDRAEYVAGGVPYVFYQTKTSSGLGGWKRFDADVQGKVTAMGEDIAGQTEGIKRGTGEAWLTAADIPNYSTLKPGNYRAFAEFLEGIGIENPRAGRFHRTWTNTAGTTFTDHVTWVESATIVHNRYRSVWTTGMGEWIDPAAVAATSSDISAARQEAVREQLFQSRGGRVGTGGKGVVALRFDHGVPAFTEHILPMLQARGLPASQCHHVDDPEADWNQANLNFGSGIEVYSHSWTHRDTTSDAEIRKEIVESRQELESLIPNAWVAGWMTPGAGAEAYDGWWAATGLEARAPFYAQQLIDSTYGSADTAPAVWNTLGARHWGHRSIDRDSAFSQYQSLIDQAAATKTGVVLMVHPSFLRDSESYIDFSEYEQVLDYIVQMRDAGKIEVLTATGMSLADPSTDYRDNLLHGDLSIWTGWGDGSTRSGTPVSGELKHSVSLANIGHAKGHVREFNLTASGSGVLSVRIYNSDNTLLDETREVAVDGETTVRIPVGIPRAGARIWFTITTVSGEVTVTDPKLQAV